MNSFYNKEKLQKVGHKSFGDNFLKRRKVSLYVAKNIEIKCNLCNDDFCILRRRIKIGNYVHIAAYPALVRFFSSGMKAT